MDQIQEAYQRAMGQFHGEFWNWKESTSGNPTTLIGRWRVTVFRVKQGYKWSLVSTDDSNEEVRYSSVVFTKRADAQRAAINEISKA